MPTSIDWLPHKQRLEEHNNRDKLSTGLLRSLGNKSILSARSYISDPTQSVPFIESYLWSLSHFCIKHNIVSLTQRSSLFSLRSSAWRSRRCLIACGRRHPLSSHSGCRKALSTAASCYGQDRYYHPRRTTARHWSNSSRGPTAAPDPMKGKRSVETARSWFTSSTSPAPLLILFLIAIARGESNRFTVPHD